jgi:outer membrane protein OmpA-like peptidoglycan-associated protein
MTKKNKLFIFILFFSSFFWNNSGCAFFSQASDKTLIKADAQFINHAYTDAAASYESYLKKNPKNFYASRQAAISYSKMNNQGKAIDHWINVYENVQATDKDKLEYAKCLLANFRADEAKKIITSLGQSSDPVVAQWGNAYSNPTVFYEDSALCKVYEVKGPNTKKPEFSPLLYKDYLVYVKESDKKKFQPFSPFKKELSSFLYEAEKEDSITFKKGKKFNKQIQNKYINGPFCFTPDDSTMYFTRSASTKLTKKTSHGKTRTLKLQIFYTAMNSYGLAHTEIHPFIHNSYDYNCMHPTISLDGKKMYFASDMPGTLGGTDIFVCEWKDENWSTPKNLGPNINTAGNESFPDITEEGILFFSSDSRPGLGGLDIFYADPTNDDKLFAEAENSGTPINSQSDDFGMFTSKNAKKGYFSSNRKNNFRDDDIYYFVNYKPRSFPARFKFVDSASLKSLPVNFTVTIGSQTYQQKLDTGAYFTTRIRAGRDFTINATAESFRFKNYVKNAVETDTLITVVMVPKSLKCIEGKIIDKDSKQPLAEAKVAIYDEDGNKYLDFTTDSTGKYKVCYLPLDKSLYIGSQKKPDYFTNTEKFIVRKDTDVLKDIFAQKIVVGKAIKVDNIYFDKGKFDVRPDAALELDKLVKLMKDNPEVIIELSSHTDCVGQASANLLLSDKRAKSSAAYIVSKGIANTRIRGKGYGESQLLNGCKCEGKVKSTCSEAEHAQNRRAEFKVTGFVGEKAVKK